MSKPSDLVLVLAAALTLFLASLPAHAATQTLEIILEENGSGLIRGSEICSPDEFEKLKAMLDSGIPTLADCFLDADRVRSILQAYYLTVREINTTISADQHKLTWTAAFTQLPKNFGPLHDISLSSRTDPGYSQFYAHLGQPAAHRPVTPDPTLAKLTVIVRLQVAGTILSADKLHKLSPRETLLQPPNPHWLPGRIEHTGEAVRWTIDAASLQNQAFDLTASIASGSAVEARYWLILMAGLTLLVLTVAFGILYRGLKKPAPPPA